MVAHDAEPSLRGHEHRPFVGTVHVDRERGDDVSVDHVSTELLER
jgi:hypothetical protein